MESKRGDGGGIDIDRYLSLGCVADEFSAEELEDLAEYLSDEEFEPRVATPEPDHSRLVVFDGLPREGKFTQPRKLEKFVRKFLAQIATVTKVEVQVNEAGEACGAAIVEFETTAMAHEAVTHTQESPIEFKGRTFELNLLRDVDKFVALEDSFDEPERKEFATQGDMHSWMSDKACRDQFVVRYDRETEIHWGETKNAPALEYGGEREKKFGKVWVDLEVQWSPQGTYLATFHTRGVVLWGGSSFAKLNRFPHMNVHAAKFSADERFLATWNGVDLPDLRACGDTDGALIVWDVKTGRPLRDFQQVQISAVPDFSWSSCGKFFARLSRRDGQDLVKVYETPGMGLLGKASIEARGVQEMQWSPTDPYLVWWSPEHRNIPACVTLTKFPSKAVVRTKNLFHVKTCRVYWQKSGDFLCVEVTRVSKSGKTEYTDFQLFRMRERNIPIEMLPFTTTIYNFAWEPVGTRFGIIHQGEGPGRFQTIFYDMGPPGGHHTQLFKLEDRPVNELFWSPLGSHVVIAGLQNLSGELIEFYDVDKQRTMGTQEHYLCTNVSWDPSGRIVTTQVSQTIKNPNPRYTNSNAFNLWTFQGFPIYDESKQKLYQFLWRPRPPSLLSTAERKDVKANLKQHIQKYLADDRRKANRIKYKKYNDRFVARNNFQSWIAKREGAYADQAEARAVLFRNFAPDEGVEVVEHTYTVELSRHVEEYKAPGAAN